MDVEVRYKKKFSHTRFITVLRLILVTLSLSVWNSVCWIGESKVNFREDLDVSSLVGNIVDCFKSNAGVKENVLVNEEFEEKF